MTKLLEINSLNVAFKIDKYILNAVCDVNLEIEKGKSLGLVGESGCGKTVTAMSVLRLLPKNAVIQSGKIFYNGENLLEYSEKQMQTIRGSKIVLIPQDPLTSLDPLYTIGDQILEAVELHRGVKGKEAKEIVIDALRSVKIPEPEKRIDDYPHQFSGGMRQRVIIGMALSCNPELIIADEPTTALDVTVQAQILSLIKEIQKERNTSMLLITHDLGVVAETCEDVAVMYAGRIVEYAEAKSLFSNPKHPYTQGLLESMPKTANKRLKPIKGQPPAITEYVSGCQFHPRCPYKMDICVKKEPDLFRVNNNHVAACYLLKQK
ncbi:MAG: ABC transporter ATP-binding protein [Candidatus Gastranaerophilaceae bacterium]|jgi:oligopeptide/dipeptide ABC transporter ATP-binding protein